ncbi:MAG: hypothetical protein ABI681_02700 [Gemmatimonadales bacterium]
MARTRQRLSDARFTMLLQLAVAVVGIVQSFLWRNRMDADGMSYVDVAYSYANGDWAGAVNGYWSPLFSWLIAALISVFHPSPASEFPMIHALNTLDFLLALVAFSFFVRQLFARFGDSGAEAGEWRRAWLTLAYASFAYASVTLQDVGRGGPDFLLAACFYCAVGLMLRVANGSGSSTLLMAALGAILGVGYLAKAVMFPVALVMLGCTAFMLRGTQNRWRNLIVASVAFGMIAAPWIAVLSQSKSRLTYSDTGKLSYAWYVDDAAINHAQEDAAHGKPSHPTRRLSTAPTIFEFGSPVRGTYPPWYDPSYWHEGVRVKPHLRLQLHRLALSAEDFLNQSWFYPGLSAVIALSLLAGAPAVRRALAGAWFVVIPVVSAFVLYSLVLVLGRHIAPFFAVGLPTLAFGIAASMDAASRQKNRAAAIVATALAAALAVMTLSQIAFIDRRLPDGRSHLEIARALHSRGVPGGSRVGVIGDSMHAYWAHLGRLRIVAEIWPDETARFWAQDEPTRRRQLELFRGAGATAVIADGIPSWADTAAWLPIGDGYRAYLMSAAPR